MPLPERVLRDTHVFRRLTERQPLGLFACPASVGWSVIGYLRSAYSVRAFLNGPSHFGRFRRL
jgi:hypothetical protein